MNRTQKIEAVAELREIFETSAAIVLSHQSGLTVGEVSDLRGKTRAANARYKVTKNRLAKIAVKGTPYEGLLEHFTGPVAISYSTDPVAAAKIINEFAKGNDKVELVAGGMGDKVMTVAEVKALADLPSLDELRAKIIAVITTPAQRIAAVTQAPAGQLARVFGAYGEKA